MSWMPAAIACSVSFRADSGPSPIRAVSTAQAPTSSRTAASTLGRGVQTARAVRSSTTMQLSWYGTRNGASKWARNAAISTV